VQFKEAFEAAQKTNKELATGGQATDAAVQPTTSVETSKDTAGPSTEVAKEVTDAENAAAEGDTSALQGGDEAAKQDN
jgi:hypothetical protein